MCLCAGLFTSEVPILSPLRLCEDQFKNETVSLYGDVYEQGTPSCHFCVCVRSSLRVITSLVTFVSVCEPVYEQGTSLLQPLHYLLCFFLRALMSDMRLL